MKTIDQIRAEGRVSLRNKLTEEDIQTIITSKLSSSKLAEMFGVNKSTITRAKKKHGV